MPFSQDDTDRIRTALQSALASTSLNQWQRTFLTDMQARFDKYGPRTRLSDKQYAKLKQILAPFEAQKATPGSQTARPWSRPTAPKSRSVSRPQSRSRRQSPSRVIPNARRTTQNLIWVFLAISGVLAVLSGKFDTTGPSLERNVTTPPADNPSVYRSADEFSITDGDTVQIYGAAKGTRLVGFNTPETFRPQCDRELAIGQQATSRLKELVRGANQVELRLVACACPPGTQGTNDCNFGRSCGVLRVDGRDVGEILISEGLAARFQCGQTSCPQLPRPWCE